MSCSILYLAVIAFAASPVLAPQQDSFPDPSRILESSPDADQEPQLLDGERWSTVEQLFHEWLSIQSLYSPEEIEELKDQLQQHVQGMSKQELERFMSNAEERLDLLLSEDAVELRSWLSHFTPEARRKILSLHGEIPDVVNMTASQIRLELSRLQELRTERAATQAVLHHTRDQQSEAILRYRLAQQFASSTRERRAARFASNYGIPPIRLREFRRYPRPRYWVFSGGGIARQLP
jgi:hypothetical protein